MININERLRLRLRLRKVFLTLTLALTLPFICFAQEWQELKGDHFLVYYDKANEEFAKEALRNSENYYTDIATDLGYVRYSNFWQWDKRVKIYIYPTQEAFLKATGQPAWSVGNANYTNKTISSFSGCDEFLTSTLPHEIAHLEFRDFVGFSGEVPLWLDEGVAQWQEKEKRQLVKFFVATLYRENNLLPLEKLMSLDVRSVREGQEAQNFYVQAVSLVGFLIERYGADSFNQFCKQLRDGKSLNDALRFVYPTQMRNTGDLEKKWLEYVAGIKIKVQRKTGNTVDTLSY